MMMFLWTNKYLQKKKGVAAAGAVGRMDDLTKEQRSYCMSRIRGKDTKPEMVVRRVVHSMGYRYRLHDPALPGKPDLVFKGRRKIIFIHGCFWHSHRCRHGQVTPKSNTEYWTKKRQRNRTRDRDVLRQLRKSGWDILVVWECQVRPSEINQLVTRLNGFLFGSQ